MLLFDRDRHEPAAANVRDRDREGSATKADARVLHYNFPDSLETYYQEAGRAGRNGKPAHSVLLYRLEDKRVQSYFLGGKYPRREETVRVIEALRGLGAAMPIAKLVELSGIGERHCKVIVAQLQDADLAERRRDRIRLVRTPGTG